MDGGGAVEESGGNVFADLGLPDAPERLLKAELGRLLRRLVTARGLTQGAAGELLDPAQPHLSDLLRGKLAGCSVGRLLGSLNALGQDVEIVVAPSPEPAVGRTRVTGPERPEASLPAGQR